MMPNGMLLQLLQTSKLQGCRGSTAVSIPLYPIQTDSTAGRKVAVMML